LFQDEFDVDAAAQELLQRAIVGLPIDAAEHLVRQILQPGHVGNAKQHAQTEQMLGKTVRIGRVFANGQCGVVVENAVEHVAGLTRRARDRLRAVDAVLVGGVRIELERAVVVAEIARINAAEQTVPLDREALAVGGGAASVAPDAAKLQAMMVIDQNGVGRFDRGVAQEPSAGVLQGLGRERVHALAHGGEAEIGAVRDQGGEQ
jgi:hypothetical protein